MSCFAARGRDSIEDSFCAMGRIRLSAGRLLWDLVEYRIVRVNESNENKIWVILRCLVMDGRRDQSLKLFSGTDYSARCACNEPFLGFFLSAGMRIPSCLKTLILQWW
jgi:hypothetical protein